MEEATNIPSGESAAPPASAQPAAAPVQEQPDSEAAILSDLHSHMEEQQQPAVEPPPVQVEPAPAPVTPGMPPEASVEAAPAETPPPPPESRLAPLFSLATLPAEEALPKAMEMVNGLFDYDPLSADLLVNSVYQVAPNHFRQRVLEEMGVKPEQVDRFKGWLANGGPQAPVLGAFPEIPMEGPDAGWVTLPSGAEVDTRTAEGMERYQTQKDLHEMKVEKAQFDATQKAAAEQRAAADAKAQAQRDYDEQMGRATAYATERYTVRDQMIDETVKSLAPEDKLFGDMFRAYAKDHLDNHPEMLSTSKEAGPHVMAGTGRVAEFAKRQEAIIRKEMNTLKQGFSNALLRLNRAEKAALGTAPVPSPGTRTLESQAPPSPDEDVPDNFADILRRGQEMDRREAAQRRATV